jgi:hypothetical protein
MNKVMLGLAVILIIVTLMFYSNRNFLKNFSVNLSQNFKLPVASTKPNLNNRILSSPNTSILPKTGI